MSTILSPVMTEKSVINLDNGLYVFNVSREATKNSIVDELKRLYDVNAVSVRIVNLPAKKISFRRRSGVQSVRRHAYIQLKAKQQIPGFELPKQKEEKKEKGN